MCAERAKRSASGLSAQAGATLKHTSVECFREPEAAQGSSSSKRKYSQSLQLKKVSATFQPKAVQSQTAGHGLLGRFVVNAGKVDEGLLRGWRGDGAVDPGRLIVRIAL